MVRVGVHVSIAGAISRAVERAQSAGCDTFQIFSRNPRGWQSKALGEEDAALFRRNIEESGIWPPVDHMPYLPNLATADPVNHEKTVQTLIAELERCDRLGIPFLVTHLGHHQGEGMIIGRERVIAAINQAISVSDSQVMLLLENTAGEKNGIGNNFPDIRAVIDGIADKGRIGVCFDTCHAFGAGYELRSVSGLYETLTLFDSAIGLDKIRVIHLNDSKGDLGSGRDRHEHIGLGYIGEEGFRTILSHELFRTRPLICETPVDARRDDTGNIQKVRELAGI